MRQTFTIPVGGDLVAASLSSGQLRGVIIDNPGGAWLQLFPTYDFIPPYVLGWATTIPAAASITVKTIPTGPSGQISTLKGDPYTVTLDSEPVTISGGVPAPGASYVAGFTPVASWSETFSATIGAGSSGLIVSPNAGQRFTILSLAAEYIINPTGSSGQSPVQVLLSSNPPTAGVFLTGFLSPEKRSFERSFGDGINWPINVGFQCEGVSTWCDELIRYSVSYMVL